MPSVATALVASWPFACAEANIAVGKVMISACGMPLTAATSATAARTLSTSKPESSIASPSSPMRTTASASDGVAAWPGVVVVIGAAVGSESGAGAAVLARARPVS